MKIGEISDRSGVPASTIRYYEKIGLLETQPRIAGKRDFDENVLFVLQFIRLAQSAGFSIDEIKSLLVAYTDDSSRGGAWLAMAKQKRGEVRARIAELAQMEGVLTELLSCRCASLSECVEKGIARNKAARRA